MFKFSVLALLILVAFSGPASAEAPQLEEDLVKQYENNRLECLDGSDPRSHRTAKEHNYCPREDGLLGIDWYKSAIKRRNLGSEGIARLFTGAKPVPIAVPDRQKIDAKVAVQATFRRLASDARRVILHEELVTRYRLHYARAVLRAAEAKAQELGREIDSDTAALKAYQAQLAAERRQIQEEAKRPWPETP